MESRRPRQPSRLLRVFLLVSFVVLCAACGAKPSETASREPRRSPPTRLVEARPHPTTLAYVGTVVAARDASLASARGGRVESYAHEVGDRVTAGEWLVRLGGSELAFASQAAAAGATQAEARLAGVSRADELPSVLAATARRDEALEIARRAEELHAQGSSSTQELSRARAGAATAEADLRVASAQASAEFGRLRELRAIAGQARAALGEKDVRAPFDGLVLERFVERGQSASPGAALVRIVDPSDVRVRFHVPQFDAGAIRIGMSGFVRREDGTLVRGHVVRTTPGLVGTENARLVELRLDEPQSVVDGTILFGARIPVWLELPASESLVEVPRSATNESAGVTRAWVLVDRRLQERLLTVARAEGDTLLVRAGIHAGEALVLVPAPDFRRGEVVR